MKIKLGFVTNSSSTSYIVMIPEDFEISDEIINHFLDECCGGPYIEELENDYEALKGEIKKIRDFIKDLKEGKCPIYRDDGCICYETISEIVESYGFVLREIDTGPDEGIISSITIENVNEFKRKISKWREVNIDVNK